MKFLKIIILLFTIAFSSTKLAAQQKEEQIIKAVSFETDKIILNNKIAYNYIKEGNRFTILSLDKQELIKGEISSLGNGKFSSLITFVKSGKQFSNEKIIGRNDLIFAFAGENVINEDFTINEVKLDAFIKKYNQLQTKS